jgi:predicted unusual protein kinase regulating ubiquinone biosynthesis (AarF/ABC1/UbiB family)
VQHLPAWQRQRAARHVLSLVSEAYGHMILGHGLFQADCHPGNILVGAGGSIALLDYGQSKQLQTKDRLAFARVISAIDRSAARTSPSHVAQSLWISLKACDTGRRVRTACVLLCCT